MGYGCLGRLRRIVFATALNSSHETGLYFIPYAEAQAMEEEAEELPVANKKAADDVRDKEDGAVKEDAPEPVTGASILKGRFAKLKEPLPEAEDPIE